ncbi:MAG: response regulator [Sulfurimonas sp.]|nr:response regulator [Sulfurimonas sp.]MDQ7060571.1 response regulator [Sulfurimonas sp.]
MKYLVTDDSKLARLSLIKSLKSHVGDEDIYQATNGQEAVEIVKNDKPDIVFLDLTMPVMDGYEALPRILELNPKLKVVVVSADIQEQAKTKVIELGAQLHVQKPINPQKMKEILEIL